jgi:hypothetical protein
MAQPSEYLPKERVVLVVGNYGSGKTEVSVNLAIDLARRHAVAIADLDIVNPYFRCREAREEMESHGIRVINPTGGYQAADLPIILPEIRGAVQAADGYVLLDVGGDDVGARVLSSLADLFRDMPYAMLQVINARRPFTDSVEGCVRIKDEIEAASRLKVSGLVSNTHLMEETRAGVILEGIDLARAVGSATGLPLEFATASSSLKEDRDLEGDLGGCQVLWIERRMLPPWKLKSKTDKAARILNRRSPES